MTPKPITPRWATQLLGDGVVCTRVIGGGTSRTTLLLEVPHRPGRIVARHDEGVGPFAGTPFSLLREADVFAAVASTGVPVPDVVAVADDGASFAVEEVAGTVDPNAEALDDYLRVLGTLHASGVQWAPTAHRGFDVDGADDLRIWREITQTHITRPAPSVVAALDALERHGATDPGRSVVCHGDAGFGNYLHSGKVVTGLVDWEMAHTGDPHDDLASVAVRATLTGVPLDDYVARIGWHWEPASGLRFDHHRYVVGVVATLTRMVISCLVALDNPRPDVDRTTQLMGLPIMEVQLIGMLAALDGTPPAPIPEVAPDPKFVAEIDQLLAEPAPIGDPGVAGRRAYIAQQRSAAPAAAVVPTHTADLLESAATRLAAFPSARRLATATIPGATP